MTLSIHGHIAFVAHGMIPIHNYQKLSDIGIKLNTPNTIPILRRDESFFKNQR